jgi:hypothetical protein
MNIFNFMLNIFNNNSFNNNRPLTGHFPGIRTPAPSPFIFEDRYRNNNMNFNPMMNNPMMPLPSMFNINNMNLMMNLNISMNNMNNLTIRYTFDDDDNLRKKDIKRNESLDVKMDVDNLLKSKKELEKKNKDIQYILNYIPFTIIKDVPKKKGDEPHCLVCLCDFELEEKVSSLPCFHCFHTKCIDEWIIRNPRCPICKFEVTLRNLIGEEFIKEHLKLIEKAKLEEERKKKRKIRKRKTKKREIQKDV